MRGEDTKIYDVAKWTGKTGFTVLTKLRFYDRRRNLEGTVLRAVVVKVIIKIRCILTTTEICIGYFIIDMIVTII